MITLLSLCVLCLAALILIPVVLLVVGLPFLLMMALLPWLLRLAGIVLLVKGLLDRPFQPENLLPAVGAFAASWLLGLLF